MDQKNNPDKDEFELENIDPNAELLKKNNL